MSFFCTKHGFAVFLNTKFTKINKGHFFPNPGFSTAYAFDNTGIHFQKHAQNTLRKNIFIKNNLPNNAM